MDSVAYLTSELAATQAILRVAHTITQDPSPPHIINALREHIFNDRVSSCAILLYGIPSDLGGLEEPRHIDIQASWSRRHGSGIGIGLRLFLRDYPDLLKRLDDEQLVQFSQLRAQRASFDPLVMGLLKAERARSLLLIDLKTSIHRLGVLVIATDKPQPFLPNELDRFRLVGGCIAVGLSAYSLAEQQEQMKQHHAAMLDAVRDGVVMVIPYDNDKGGHVFIANHRMELMFDVPRGTAGGRSLIDMLSLMRIPEVARQDLRALWLSTPVQAPTVLHGEFPMVNADGQPVDIEWYSAPIYQDSAVLGRIYTFHDVTPKRTAERLSGAFLSRVSHELRTPLTSIAGFAEFILEVNGDAMPPLAREYTEIILNSARHLNTVFTDMIEIARADAGELKLRKTNAHMPDIIINSVARLELHYRKRGQQVIMELDDDLPLVSVDVDKINQVVTNLLSNAIKYSPEASKIRILTQLIEQSSDLPKTAPVDVVLPAILITVRDQGKGVPAQEVEQVFLPFYRTDEAKIQRVEGVGLGLAVTRSIVEMHRGKIWAAARGQVRGGCFFFTLPTA